MEIRVEPKKLAEVDSDALVIVGFEGAPPDTPAADQTKELYDSGEFSGKALEIAILHRPGGLKAKRLVLAGGGKRDKFDAAELRKLSGAVVRALKAKGVHTIAFALDDAWRSDDFAAAAVEGAVLADLENDRYKTDPKKNEKKVDSFSVLGGSQAAVDRGRVLAEAQNFTRDLANEPANVLTPTLLAERATQMAAEFGLECEVLDQDRMRQLGMGALLGVAQGSAEPPALIVIRYQPASAPATRDHLGLVGKGVTFDTGGISIKPAEGMEKMRYDMAGGAAVLGAMRAIAQIKPGDPGDRAGADCRKYARRKGSAARRHREIALRQNRRSTEHRCRRPAHPDRCAHLRAAAGLHAPGGRRNIDGRNCRGARDRQRRRLHQQQRFFAEAAGSRAGRGREDLAHADGRRIQRAAQKLVRRSAQHRRTCRRVHHRSLVHS